MRVAIVSVIMFAFAFAFGGCKKEDQKATPSEKVAKAKTAKDAAALVCEVMETEDVGLQFELMLKKDQDKELAKMTKKLADITPEKFEEKFGFKLDEVKDLEPKAKYIRLEKGKKERRAKEKAEALKKAGKEEEKKPKCEVLKAEESGDKASVEIKFGDEIGKLSMVKEDGKWKAEGRPKWERPEPKEEKKD